MPIRILSLPGRGSGNQYIELFYDTLAPEGIDLIGQLEFDPHWFNEHLNEFDAIHLHWPESIWRNYADPNLKKLAQSNIPGTWRLSKYIENSFNARFKENSLLWFKNTLRFLHTNKKKIIWTWHNIEPHENVDEFDRAGQQLLASYADIIIFHSEYAEKQCRSSYDIPNKTVVMPHGNYEGVYPTPRDRATVIAELGLDPGLPIVAMLGNIREYKGIDLAIDACALLQGKVQFLCAGNPLPSFDWNAIVKKASVLKHCALAPRFISDQEFSDYTHASDIMLLPYRSVTGSGALLAALTLGKGVVASDLPFFRELLGNTPHAGVLTLPDNALELKQAIEQYLKVDADIRSKAAIALAGRYSWNNIVPPVAYAIKSCVHPKRRPRATAHLSSAI